MKNVSFSSKYFQTCIILCNLFATCFYLPSNFDNYFCCSQLWRAGAANMEGRVTSWKELSLLFQPGFSLSPSWTLDFTFAIWIFAREVLRNRLEQLMENEKKEDRQLAQFRLIILYTAGFEPMAPGTGIKRFRQYSFYCSTGRKKCASCLTSI